MALQVCSAEIGMGASVYGAARHLPLVLTTMKLLPCRKEKAAVTPL
jgi:hypothetical protein